MKYLYLLPILACQLLSIAEAASPVFTKILPRGGKPGTTVDVTFYGDRMKDIREVLFYSKGLSVSEIKPDEKNGNKVARGKLAIAPDAKIGEHKLRIITNSGISALKTFWVGPYETVLETEPNSDFAEPQIVAMNQTIEGRTDSEDVDYYAVAVKKGQRLSVEVEAMRLGNILFDPYVAILNEKRFELAAADDTALLL
ncbi:MAG: peptidase, partial [Euryarchaeota archaeon]|nr:peptidase [Euryarchaeota archaeon]